MSFNDGNKLYQFINCKILRDHRIYKEDIWVRDGKFVDPEKIFYDEKIVADIKIDCENHLIAPGFIDLQINGGFGLDFSFDDDDDIEERLTLISKKLLAYGVTGYCPTIVTSLIGTYHKILPKINYRQGGRHGATVLGAHLEGPFINEKRKGAHKADCILEYREGISKVEEVYGSLDNVKIITLAPELENSIEIIKQLTNRGIIVSLGHSNADLLCGELAYESGATLITHLFNAMLPFHHRDPGLVGLLTLNKSANKRQIFFGLIADGSHTLPAALRIAYRVHPDGLILVTDAVSALGLTEGKHKLGQLDVEIHDGVAYIAGTTTLCGSIAPMIQCIRNFVKATDCPLEYALEAASLHPAMALGIENRKGTLNFGADADFSILTDDDDLEIISTWISGECVYNRLNN